MSIIDLDQRRSTSRNNMSAEINHQRPTSRRGFHRDKGDPEVEIIYCPSPPPTKMIKNPSRSQFNTEKQILTSSAGNNRRRSLISKEPVPAPPTFARKNSGSARELRREVVIGDSELTRPLYQSPRPPSGDIILSSRLSHQRPSSSLSRSNSRELYSRLSKSRQSFNRSFESSDDLQSVRSLSRFSVLPSIGSNKGSHKGSPIYVNNKQSDNLSDDSINSACKDITIALKREPGGLRELITTNGNEIIQELFSRLSIECENNVILDTVLNKRIEDFSQTIDQAGIQDKTLLHLQLKMD